MTLTIDDFANFMFDAQRPTRRSIPARGQRAMTQDEEECFAFDGTLPEYKERVIEGVTFTDGLHKIGYTYFEEDGVLQLNYWHTVLQKNVRLCEKPITSTEEFEKQIKAANRKIEKLYR